MVKGCFSAGHLLLASCPKWHNPQGATKHFNMLHLWYFSAMMAVLLFPPALMHTSAHSPGCLLWKLYKPHDECTNQINDL